MRLDTYEVIHAADHIREALEQITKRRWADMEHKTGIFKRTPQRFCDGENSIGVDYLEHILNAYGYTLTVEKIGVIHNEHTKD